MAVAVLSSASFNPVDVIIDTVRIAGASPVKFTYKDVTPTELPTWSFISVHRICNSD